jgi:hypothetical protein
MSKTASYGMLKCSFCGKSQKEVKKLIAGPGVYICDECIELCNEIIDDELDSVKAGKVTRGMGTAPDSTPDELLSELAQSAGQFLPMEKHLEELVRQLRKRGATWAKIGEALGMTRQAAWARFSGED